MIKSTFILKEPEGSYTSFKGRVPMTGKHQKKASPQTLGFPYSGENKYTCDPLDLFPTHP